MITITRRLWFSAGHRVWGHEGHCANLHGHNYMVFLYARPERSYKIRNSKTGEEKLVKPGTVVESEGQWDWKEVRELDPIGRVIDFSVLKARFGSWIDTYWDHGFLYFQKDWACQTLFTADEKFLTNKSFACDFNPTAENMAKHLLDIAPVLLADTGVELYKVKLYETENCFAEVSLEA